MCPNFEASGACCHRRNSKRGAVTIVRFAIVVYMFLTQALYLEVSGAIAAVIGGAANVLRPSPPLPWRIQYLTWHTESKLAGG